MLPSARMLDEVSIRIVCLGSTTVRIFFFLGATTRSTIYGHAITIIGFFLIHCHDCWFSYQHLSFYLKIAKEVMVCLLMITIFLLLANLCMIT
jgi:hypothetical protein